MPASLFIVSAPSGAGKTSLLKELVTSTPGLAVSISCTTRARRTGEVDGQHYHFLDEAQFLQRAEAGEFVEQAEVFGHHYGTRRDDLVRGLQAGQDLILEIDWQGARQVRRSFPEAVGIFILPPSAATLNERLRARATDSPAVIERRMQAARAEMSHYGEYDYVVVNDDFQTAVDDLRSIVRGQRLRCPAQVERHARLLEELLAQG